MARKSMSDRFGEFTHIRPQQIRLHSKPDDAWIVIRGNVYNVTEYLAFHPGGRENMMRGVVLDDATDLFNEVHPWVNYDKILTKGYLGVVNFRESRASDSGIVRFESSDVPSDKPSIRTETAEVPHHIVRQVNRMVTFSWIQEHDVLLLVFNTGRYGNPFFEIRRSCDNQWTFVITFMERVFIYKYTPMGTLKRPPRFKVFYDSGAVEIGFEKITKISWLTCGDMVYHTRNYIAPIYSKKYVIKEHVLLNKHTFMVVLQKRDQSICNAPLGSYITLHNDVNDRREYTPIPYFFLTGSKHDVKETYNQSLFTFLIRRYSDGHLSNYLYSKKVGDTILGGEPSGFFHLQLIEHKKKFMFLAGGVGVTPFLGIIQFLLEKKDLLTQKIMLVMFNPTLEHQFLLDRFAVLSNDHRFTFHCVLTKPPPEYTGLCGHMSENMMVTLIRRQFTFSEIPDIFFFVCGPTPFLNACNEQFIIFDTPVENTFFFQPLNDPPRESTISQPTRGNMFAMDDDRSRDTMDRGSSKESRRSTSNKSWKKTSSRSSNVNALDSSKMKYCQIL